MVLKYVTKNGAVSRACPLPTAAQSSPYPCLCEVGATCDDFHSPTFRGPWKILVALFGNADR